MSKTRKKKVERFTYYGLGFPIDLLDVPMIEVDGDYVPDIDFNKLEDVMAIAVPLKPARLTGNEVKFLRLRLGLSPKEFADLFEYSRPGILKWEEYADEPTQMQWSTEKDLRLHMLVRENVSSAQFRKAYELLNGLSERGPRYMLPKSVVRQNTANLANRYLNTLSRAH